MKNENIFSVYQKNETVWKFSYTYFTFEIIDNLCMIKRLKDSHIIKTYNLNVTLVNP